MPRESAPRRPASAPGRWSLQEIRAPLLFAGLGVILLSWIFARPIAEVVDDLWDRPVAQAAAYFLLAAVSTVAQLCVLFAILSSIMMKLRLGAWWSNRRISAVSLAASVAVMLGAGVLAGLHWSAEREQQLAREARIKADFAEIAKTRDVEAQCWNEGRRVEAFDPRPFFGRAYAGDVEFPSEAASILSVVSLRGVPVFYEGNVTATGFTVHFCFASLTDDRAMLFSVWRSPPPTMSVAWNTSRVSFEDAVRKEAGRFAGHVRAGRAPDSFEPKARGVRFQIGSNYLCRESDDPEKPGKICGNQYSSE